jgi:hypothetical protein
LYQPFSVTIVAFNKRSVGQRKDVIDHYGPWVVTPVDLMDRNVEDVSWLSSRYMHFTLGASGQGDTLGRKVGELRIVGSPASSVGWNGD